MELVGRAMAEDAIAFHTSADQETKELVADNSIIRRLAQPKVVCNTAVFPAHICIIMNTTHTHTVLSMYSHLFTTATPE